MRGTRGSDIFSPRLRLGSARAPGSRASGFSNARARSLRRAPCRRAWTCGSWPCPCTRRSTRAARPRPRGAAGSCDTACSDRAGTGSRTRAGRTSARRRGETRPAATRRGAGRTSASCGGGEGRVRRRRRGRRPRRAGMWPAPRPRPFLGGPRGHVACSLDTCRREKRKGWTHREERGVREPRNRAGAERVPRETPAGNRSTRTQFFYIRSQFRRRGNKRWLVSICIFHAGAHPHRRSRRPQSPSRVACASSCLRVGILRLSLTPPRDVDVDVDIDTTPRRSLAPPFDRSFDRSSPRTTPSRRTRFSAAPPPWRASPPASGARETSSPWRRARRSTPPSSPAPPRASPRTRRWRSRAYPPRREGPSRS